MSKTNSGLFRGTIGFKNYNNSNTQPADSQIRSAMRSAVQSWAKNKADELLNRSNRQRNRFNTACIVYDYTTGKYYYGRNNGINLKGTPKNPILFGDSNIKGLLPSNSLNRYELGNCAEVDAVNSALNNGANIKNLRIYTIHTTRSSFGTAKHACKNCTATFKGNIKRNYTGWHREGEE